MPKAFCLWVHPWWPKSLQGTKNAEVGQRPLSARSWTEHLAQGHRTGSGNGPWEGQVSERGALLIHAHGRPSLSMETWFPWATRPWG